MATSAKSYANAPFACTECRARVDGLCSGSSSRAASIVNDYRSADRHVRTGQDVFGVGEQCEGLYNLVNGWVALYNLLDDGRRQILHFGLPGAVLCFNPDERGITTYGVQALTDTVVCVIPREKLGRLLERHPDLGLRLARLMSRDRSLSFGHLTSIGRHCARERVAQLLLELFIRYRAQWPGHRIEEMQLPLTQEHIGDATGLTGVHVNRVLRELKKDGVVEFHYRRLRVLDPDRLVDIAKTDPHLLMPWTEFRTPGSRTRRQDWTGLLNSRRVAA